MYPRWPQLKDQQDVLREATGVTGSPRGGVAEEAPVPG